LFEILIVNSFLAGSGNIKMLESLFSFGNPTPRLLKQ